LNFEYVMLELGHAAAHFDYDKPSRHKIVVRRPPGQGHRGKPPAPTLTSDATRSPHLMLTMARLARRGRSAESWAGAETEISFSTKDVLIELRLVRTVAIPRARVSLKRLHTELHALRRGADPEMAELASRRAGGI